MSNQNSTCNFFPNIMIVQLNMLGMCMEDGIHYHVEGIEITA